MILTATVCLALNMYHEARGEPLAGQLLVAEVTLNRARNRNQSICETVYEPHQFSWTSDGRSDIPKDIGTYTDLLILSKEIMRDPDILPGSSANYFHSVGVRPKWSYRFKRLFRVGNHIFYTSKGA